MRTTVLSGGHAHHSHSHGHTTQIRTQFLPPSVALCIALLVFFSAWRRRGGGGWMTSNSSSELLTNDDLSSMSNSPLSLSISNTGSIQTNGITGTRDIATNVAEVNKAVEEELEQERAQNGEDVVADFANEDPEPIVDVSTHKRPDSSSLSDLTASKTSNSVESIHGIETQNQGKEKPRIPKENLVVAGLGDVLLLGSMAKESRMAGNYSHLWDQVEFLWQRHAHFSFANLEGTAGPVNKKGVVVTPRSPGDPDVYSMRIDLGGFNYHENLVEDLARSNVDVLTTANNHAFDRGLVGITITASLIEKAGQVQVGAIQEVGDPSKAHLRAPDGWYRLTISSNGWRVAWVGCTNILCAECRYSLRAPQAEVKKRILFCESAPALVSQLAKRKDVDAVIVGAHWGAQFVDQYAPRTMELAHRILDAGAAIVFGNHPHVMQGAEHYKTLDGRSTYVTYSIGSLTSGLGSAPKLWKSRTSAVVFVELVKFVRYVPICEVKTLSGLRTMMATQEVPGNKCTKEESWVKYLLGGDDYFTPADLPLLSSGRGEWKLVNTNVQEEARGE